MRRSYIRSAGRAAGTLLMIPNHRQLCVTPERNTIEYNRAGAILLALR